MCEVVSKDFIRYPKYLLDEHGPAVISILRTGDDAGNYPLYIRANQSITAMVPANQRVPYFNRFQRFIPAPIEKVVKDLRDSTGTECRMGRIQTNDESIVSDRFGD